MPGQPDVECGHALRLLDQVVVELVGMFRQFLEVRRFHAAEKVQMVSVLELRYLWYVCMSSRSEGRTRGRWCMWFCQ